MKKPNGKKSLMMAALVAALGVAVYLNYYLTTEPALQTGTETSDVSDDDQGVLGEATFVGATVSGTTTAPSTGMGTTTVSEADYFKTARDNRTAAREEALSILQEVLDNGTATAQEKTAAGEQAQSIASNVLQESHIENLIIAKGFAEAVVYIEDNHCSVVVDAEDLQPQETLQIQEIVMTQAELPPESIQIMTPQV